MREWRSDMKKMKKLMIFMLIATMLFAVGCSSNNDEANNTGNEVSQEETDNTPAENPYADLDYKTGLDENGFFANVKATDLVELGDYESIAVPSENHTIPAEAVQANIDKILQGFATSDNVTDRAIVDGDTVNIDYVGSVDGEEFEGGSTGGNGTDVTIGVTSYIDDFLEQLIGHTPGESFDIEVTFPEEYGVENLNGKDAVFAITVNHIVEKNVPELTDEFVAANLTEQYKAETVDALKASIEADMKENAIKGYIQQYLNENNSVTSIPETVQAYQINVMKNYYEMSAIQYGMTIDEFLSSYVGYENVDALIEGSQAQLESQSQFALIIQAIAEDADLSVTDDLLKAYFIKYTGNEDYSQFEEIYGLPYLKNSILTDTVLDYLVANADLQ